MRLCVIFSNRERVAHHHFLAGTINQENPPGDDLDQG